MSDSDPQQPTIEQVKQIIRDDLKPDSREQLDDDTPLFGGGLDLDSLDVLLLVTSMEKQFGVEVPREGLQPGVFATPRIVTHYIQSLAAGNDPAAKAETPALSPQQLLARLPHGEPFRFVTELRRVVPGQSGEGVWRVDGFETFFVGHFPGHPIVPAVLLTEALAQLSGIVGGAKSLTQTFGSGRLAQMDVRCGAAIVPPAEIVLRSRLMNKLESLHQFEVQAVANDQVAAEGTVTLKLSEAGDVSPQTSAAQATRG